MIQKKNWLCILITLVVFSGFLTNYLDRVPKRHYCDFRVYYKAGQDVLAGKNIYVRETEAVTPFKYSPFFAFLCVPLGKLPIKAAAAVFFTVNFFMTLFIFKLSFDLAAAGLAASFSIWQRVLIYALTLLASARYILLVWDSGQSSILMCLLILLGFHFLSKEKETPAGAFFASAILVKYTPAIFLPYLLVQRKFKAFCWAVFFGVLFLLIPALIVGLQKDLLYLSSWIPSIVSTSLDQFSYIDNKNQSIYSMFLRFFSPTIYHVNFLSISFDQALFYGRLAVLFIYLAVFIPGKSRSTQSAIDMALLMVCMSLFNPNGWMLNFVSLIPSFVLLIQYTVMNKAKDKFILFSLIAAFVLINITSQSLAGRSVENFGCNYSFTAWGGLIIYAALLKLKFSPKTVPSS